MDDLRLSRAVATVLASDDYATFSNLMLGTTPPGVIAAAQDAADLQRPTLAIRGEFTGYLNARKGDLILELRSRMGEEGDSQHAARFAALFNALLGAEGADDAETASNRTTAKTALKAALATQGVTLADYGPGENAFNQTFDGEDLVTTITLKAAWRAGV